MKGLRRLYSKRNKGFSLVETLAGLAILSILIATSTNGFLRLTQANRRNQSRGDAAAVGRKIIDELRLRDIENLPTNGFIESSNPDDPNTVYSPEVIEGREFDVLITYCPPAPAPDLCTATQRLIQIDVSDRADGRRVYYSTQTVFTAL